MNMTMKLIRLAPFFTWALVTAVLMISGEWKSFLAPRFFWFLPIIVIFSFSFFIVEIMSKTERKGDLKSIVESLLLTFALVPIIFMSGKTLDSSDVNQRWGRMAPPAEQQTISQKTVEINTIADKKKVIKDFLADEEVDIIKTGEEVVYPVRITDLYGRSEYYEGKKVSVEGYLLKHKNVTQDFGENAIGIFRFVVSCCVADARPLVIICNPQNPVLVKENAWMRATGRFKVLKGDFGRAAYLEDVELFPAQMLEDPYLY